MNYFFVSSTFRDMQSERDLLHEKIIPKINQKAKAYGEEVGLIDLRWGVNTAGLEEDESTKKVLSVCFDEIDRCAPYMLVFLGERYGWIPSIGDSDFVETARTSDISLLEKSVTELEIEYGVFAKEQSKQRCIFCIRQPIDFGSDIDDNFKCYKAESDEDTIRMERLKKRIYDLMGDQVITYNSEWCQTEKRILLSDSFEEILTDKMYELISEHWEQSEALCWQEKELLGFRRIIQKQVQSFYGRIEDVEYVKGLLEEDYYDLLKISGSRGQGKTALACKLIKTCQDEGYPVVYFLGGFSHRSSTYEDMFKLLIYQLGALIGEERLRVNTKETSSYNLVELLDVVRAQCHLIEGKKPIIIIDGLEELDKSVHSANARWLGLNSHFYIASKMIIIKSNEVEYDVVGLSNGNNRIDEISYSLSKLEGLDIEGIITTHLHLYGKKMNEQVIKTFINKVTAAGNLQDVSYVILLLQSLLVLDKKSFFEADQLADGGSGIDAMLMQKIVKAPDSFEALLESTLEEAGNRLDIKEWKQLFYVLLATRYGLSMKDLRNVFDFSKTKWIEVDMLRMIDFLPYIFEMSQDGHLNFTNRRYRNCSSVVSETLKEYHEYISKYTIALPASDWLSANEGLYHSVCCREKNHMIWHVIQDGKSCGNPIWGMSQEELRKIIMDPDLSEKRLQEAKDAGYIRDIRGVAFEKQVYDYLISDNKIWVEEALLGQGYSDDWLGHMARFILWPLFECFINGDIERGLEFYNRFKQYFEINMNINNPEHIRFQAFCYVRVGELEYAQNNWETGEYTINEALKIFDNHFRKETFIELFPGGVQKDYVYIDEKMLEAFLQLKQYEYSKGYAEEVIEIWETLDEKNSKSETRLGMLRGHSYLARTYDGLGDDKNAIYQSLKAIVSYNLPISIEELPVTDMSQFNIHINNLVPVSEVSGEGYDGDIYKVSMELYSKNGFYNMDDDSNPERLDIETLMDIASCYNLLGKCLFEQGEYIRAKNSYLYAHSYLIVSMLNGSRKPLGCYVDNSSALAICYESLGDNDSKLKLEKAIREIA